MAERMIILKEERSKTFRETLEETALQLTQHWQNAWHYNEESSLVREIRLNLDSIDKRRELQRMTDRRLGEEHFYTYRGLVQQKRELQYREFRPNSVDQLKAKLSQIERERRSLRFSTEDMLARLHERLFYQIRKLKLLRGNGGREARRQA